MFAGPKSTHIKTDHPVNTQELGCHKFTVDAIMAVFAFRAFLRWLYFKKQIFHLFFISFMALITVWLSISNDPLYTPPKFACSASA